MHIITVSVTVSLIRIQLLMILEKGFVNRIIKKLKKKILRKAINFFWAGPVLGG